MPVKWLYTVKHFNPYIISEVWSLIFIVFHLIFFIQGTPGQPGQPGLPGAPGERVNILKTLDHS